MILVSPYVSNLFLLLSLFTRFYAGVGTLFETDLKKLVALSTLSHLGFIGLAIAIGNMELAFFHLLIHALFKSLLFIGVGDYIVIGQHYQDARQLSGGLYITPLSSLVISASLLSLLGFPFTSGFYSKDYILEFTRYSGLSFFLLSIIFINVGFTIFYTLRILSYIVSANIFSSPYFLVVGYPQVHFVALGILSMSSFLSPSLYFHITSGINLSLPESLHYLPVFILLILVF